MAVEDIIASQQAFATNAISQANTFLAVLTNLASSPFFVQSNAVPAAPVTFDANAAQALLLSMFPQPIVAGTITATAPSTPSFTAIDALPNVSLPPEPNIVIPNFTLTLAMDDLVAPPNNFIHRKREREIRNDDVRLWRKRHIWK